MDKIENWTKVKIENWTKLKIGQNKKVEKNWKLGNIENGRNSEKGRTK